jgi:hypothetical protein
MCCWLNSALVIARAAHSLDGPLQRSFCFSPVPPSLRRLDRLAVISSSSSIGSGQEENATKCRNKQGCTAVYLLIIILETLGIH